MNEHLRLALLGQLKIVDLIYSFKKLHSTNKMESVCQSEWNTTQQRNFNRTNVNPL